MNPEKLFPQPDSLGLPLVDLAAAPFWAVLVCALLLLPIIREARPRATVLAFLNLAFLTSLYPPGLPSLLAGLAGFWVALRGLGQPRRRGLWLWATAGLSLCLFMLHKRPDWAADIRMGLLSPVLAAVGFSYVCLRGVEVFRAVWEERHPCPGIVELINYLLPFHMIAAGPIQPYDEFRAQPAVPPPPTVEDVLSGMERLSSGLFKKFFLAQALNTVFLTGFRNASPRELFLEVQLFYLWLYLDFSGYTDVMVGAGRLVGVATPENFDHPLRARNIFDFWNRWHMTLSRFIRVNIFVPMQVTLMRRDENRSPLSAALISWFLAFFLSGLWHALTLPFLLWGVMHGSGLVICKLYETWLIKSRGRKGYKAYMANPWARALAVAITFEFVAAATALPFIPWSWMWSQWTTV